MQLRRQVERVQPFGFATTFFGHLGANVLPQVAEHRHLGPGNVVGNRNPWQLDDATFDSVHQREVAQRPGKQSAFGIARATQEEWGGGQIEYARYAEFAVDGFQAGDPQARGLVVFFGLFSVVAFQIDVFHFEAGLLAVAVVGFVVDDKHIAQAHKVWHHALEHLAFGFQRVERINAPALQQQTAAFGQLHALARLEGVVIGDDDLGALQVAEHVTGHQLAAGVVAVRVIGLQDAQAVFDGEAGRDQQKTTRELFAIGPTHRVDGLPCDEHRHHGGLARTCGQLKGQAHQLRVGIVVGAGEVVHEDLTHFANLRHNLGQPNCRLNGFNLAEKRTNAAEVVMAPVLQETGGFRCYTPVVRIFQGPPLVHLGSDRIDDG